MEQIIRKTIIYFFDDSFSDNDKLYEKDAKLLMEKIITIPGSVEKDE